MINPDGELFKLGARLTFSDKYATDTILNGFAAEISLMTYDQIVDAGSESVQLHPDSPITKLFIEAAWEDLYPRTWNFEEFADAHS